jgi:hypothetical protein
MYLIKHQDEAAEYRNRLSSLYEDLQNSHTTAESLRRPGAARRGYMFIAPRAYCQF